MNSKVIKRFLGVPVKYENKTLHTLHFDQIKYLKQDKKIPLTNYTGPHDIYFDFDFDYVQSMQNYSVNTIFVAL
jgi:hypothetical protein